MSDTMKEIGDKYEAKKKANARASKKARVVKPKKPAGKAKAAPKKETSSSKLHVLVVMVIVNDQGNVSEFHLGEKSKLTKKETKKLMECHHGAMNDDGAVYEQI